MFNYDMALSIVNIHLYEINAINIHLQMVVFLLDSK